jgi:hypothetical protein
MSEIDTSSPEFKAALKDAVEEATAGLVAKRDELLGEVKKLRKGQQVDPAEVEKIEAERDAARAEAAEAKKQAAKTARELEGATKRAAEVEQREQRLLVDNGINEALAKAGVNNPALAKAAKALLVSQAQVVADGDARVVKIGDKALSDAVSEWAGSDEGKHFVTAASNTGGNSQGGGNNSGGAAKTITRQAFEALSPASRMEHINAGGVVN